jgi:hypothetical protein
MADLTANAAHVQQVTVVVHTAPSLPHEMPSNNWHAVDPHVSDDPRDPETGMAQDPLLDDTPHSPNSLHLTSEDDDEIEAIIREAVNDASHDGAPEAAQAAIAKFRKMKGNSKRGRPSGNKRSRSAATSPAEPARATVDPTDAPPAKSEVAPCIN